MRCFLPTKTRMRGCTIAVGRFHTILKDSKICRVDSNDMLQNFKWTVGCCACSRCATLGAYNTIRGDTKLENCLLPFLMSVGCGADGSIVPGPWPWQWFISMFTSCTSLDRGGLAQGPQNQDILADLHAWSMIVVHPCRGEHTLKLKPNFSPLCYGGLMIPPDL